MTSEMDSLKTNEFLRRRKLRLQQVREQSKDIAKKIRQRAKVEKVRQVVELDARKQSEYLHRQERLVKQLEQYYSKGIQNVGASHRTASEIRTQDDLAAKADLSKQRGKEAATELRKKRQKILDEHKKKLDRKLQARETANEISREKSATVINKVQSIPPSAEETSNKNHDSAKDCNTKPKDDIRDIAMNDMATQWDLEEIPNEWEPNIPTLALPKDDNSVKESNNNIIDSKSDKSKRLDLFALSDEMPSSLRGGVINQEERVPIKSSLTLVSEYLRNRGLRLRESDTATSIKKMEDLQSLKQTILHTRASKEGTVNVCHVHDEELVPVPTWHAENNCGFCAQSVSLHKQYDKCLKSASNMHINKKFSSLTSSHKDLLPGPVLRGASPFRRIKIGPRSFSAKEPIPPKDKEIPSSTHISSAPKKASVTIYNHSTRDTRDIPCNNERLVVRDIQANNDAYSQAMKESNTNHNLEKGNKKIQEIRSRVAMTKQNVEKEYRDTLSFLNALPKDKGQKPIRTAYMDEQRQQMQKDSRQQKLQQEFRKIEKECSKHSCRNKIHSKPRCTSKSNGDVFENSDFQYSWMPVPEGDGNLAIHTIPTTLKEGKSGNTVKFSKVDSYHEYRSRHKHTPPTKETAPEKPEKHVKAVVIQNSSDSESVSSDSSQNIRLETRDQTPQATEKLSDAERIIIYKILDSKVDKKTKTTKLMKDIAKSLSLLEKQKSKLTDDRNDQSKEGNPKKSGRNVENRVSFEQLNEGVYKAVTENGDNIASMYFNDKDGNKVELSTGEIKDGRLCLCKKKLCEDQQDIGTTCPQWESGDIPSTSRISQKICAAVCHCGCKIKLTKGSNDHIVQPSTATSTSSFKTATNDKANNALPDGGFIQFIDDGGQETGKLYIGASGLLKDDAYEVVIQLRKKGDEKENTNEKSEDTVVKVYENNSNNDKEESVALITPIATQLSTEVTEPPRNKEDQIVEVSTETELQENQNTEPTVVNIISEVLTNPVSKQTISNVESTDNIHDNQSSEPNKFSEKGVSTSFQDSYAIPSHVLKTSLPRPATSTYTQTSMSSPNHRPIYFHMSSSTSTAYMSPPEMILPPFMRQDYQLTDEDISDPRNYEMNKIELTEEHEYSQNDECRCTKCKHARKVTIENIRASTRHRCKKGNAGTPPNTVRSSIRDGDDISFSHENTNDMAPPISHKKSKCKCRKCDSRNCLNKLDSCPNDQQSRHLMAAKHSSRNLVMRVTSSAASSNKDSRQSSKKCKTNLKPAIKNYVDKLLALNRESLKAVHVVDQECSSISTPGSSIVEVPNNIDHNKPAVGNTISLQQINNMLRQKDDIKKKCEDNYSNQNSEVCIKKQYSKKNRQLRLPRKKTGQKLKSLNISKHLYREKSELKKSENKPAATSSSSTRAESAKQPVTSNTCKKKVRSKSSPTPRLAPNSDTTDKSVNSDITHTNRNNLGDYNSKFPLYKKTKQNTNERRSHYNIKELSILRSNRAVLTSSPDSDRNMSSLKCNNVEIPMSISTQTSLNADSELNYIKLAEDKLHNMEKIADLTEKCTQRLSNLAKVLEEVRKNKSLAYNQISSSDTTSDSDHKSDKISNNLRQTSHETSNINKRHSVSPVPDKSKTNEVDNKLISTGYVPFLSDIPKPVAFKNVNSDLGFNSSSSSSRKSTSPSPNPEFVIYDHSNKSRGKPPPALSRIHLKHVQDYVVPHELSTVVEVDSPMSVKLKSSRNDTKLPDASNRSNNGKEINNECSLSSLVEVKGTNTNYDLLVSNTDIPNQTRKISTTDSDNSKIQMIDMNQFNEIMLKPFFSLQEYAKQCNIGALEDGSNVDDIVKDDPINDEFSSLHSDGSLPDVISELLKRNIISEPFKFDTGSNANSTTVSSESTISILALSRARQGKKKPSLVFQNKENIGESSDTLSISSNPDLENAFKKLGMGWASSTLKKTKERLALSSSSNTSSSSLSQFKVKSFNQDIPAIVTDTVSSVVNISNKPVQINAPDSSKNAEQQTSLTNSMTVKEFLANELAKKITFNNKSTNDTEEEFMSLFETKMPEDMKHSSRVIREEDSVDNSMLSGNNNRARTSTPVQLFKSTTYHSSSGSNISNGLFSNADDLSSVKVTSNSMKHSTSDKDDLIIPNFSLRMKRGSSECSKSE